MERGLVAVAAAALVAALGLLAGGTGRRGAAGQQVAWKPPLRSAIQLLACSGEFFLAQGAEPLPAAAIGDGGAGSAQPAAAQGPQPPAAESGVSDGGGSAAGAIVGGVAALFAALSVLLLVVVVVRRRRRRRKRRILEERELPVYSAPVDEVGRCREEESATLCCLPSHRLQGQLPSVLRALIPPPSLLAPTTAARCQVPPQRVCSSGSGGAAARTPPASPRAGAAAQHQRRLPAGHSW